MRDNVSGMMMLLASFLVGIALLIAGIQFTNTASKMNRETTTKKEYVEELNSVSADTSYINPNRILTSAEVIEFIRDNGNKYDYFIEYDTDDDDSNNNNVVKDLTTSSADYLEAYQDAAKNNTSDMDDIADKNQYLLKSIYSADYLRDNILDGNLEKQFKPFVVVQQTPQTVEAYGSVLEKVQANQVMTQGQTAGSAGYQTVVTGDSEKKDLIQNSTSNTTIGKATWTAINPTPVGGVYHYYTLLEAENSGLPYTVYFVEWAMDKYNIYWKDVANKNFKYSGSEELPDSYKTSSPTYYPPNASTVSRLGYTFNGWNPSSIPSGSAGDVIFGGNWTANKYNIHLNANGGTVSSGADVVAEYSDGYDNSGYELPGSTEVTRTGYEFLGWYTDAACTNPVGSYAVGGYYDTNGQWVGGVVQPNSDGSISNQTYYAKWKAVPSAYEVVCKSTSGLVIKTTSGSCDYGTSITVDSGNAPNIAGYTRKTTIPFTKTITNTDATNPQQVVVEYEPIVYNINYDLGNAGGSMPSSAPTTYTVESKYKFTVASPVPVGYDSTAYIFKGWDIETTEGHTGTLTVTALWQGIVKAYTINCISTTKGQTVATFKIDIDLSTLNGAKTVDIIAPLEKSSGYTKLTGSLLGYDVASGESSKKQITTTSTSVTFKYTPIEYKLIYEALDDSSVTFFEKSTVVKKTYTVEDAETKIDAVPERLGFVFKSWDPDTYKPDIVEDATAENEIHIKGDFDYAKYPLQYLSTHGDVKTEVTVKGETAWKYYTINKADHYYDDFELDDMPSGFCDDGYYYSFDSWQRMYKGAAGDNAVLRKVPTSLLSDTNTINQLASIGIDLTNNKYYRLYPDKGESYALKKTSLGTCYYSVTQVGGINYYEVLNNTTTVSSETAISKLSDYAAGTKTVDKKTYYIYNNVPITELLEDKNGKQYYYGKEVTQGAITEISYIDTTGGASSSVHIDAKTNKITTDVISKGLDATIDESQVTALTFNAVWKKVYWMQDYDYTGAVQEFKAPATGYYMLECWGANGGSNNYAHSSYNSHGGVGGYTKALYKLTKDSTIYIYVGGKGSVVASGSWGTGGGYNGGGHGSSTGAGGGGMTHISTKKLDAAKATVSGTITTYFSYTGGVQSYTAPAAGKYRLEAWGASGGGDASMVGLGGYTAGEVTLSQGETIYIYVGQGGSRTTDGNGASATYNGGGDGGSGMSEKGVHLGGSGGGATDFRTASGAWNANLGTRFLVAGGGGGSGCASSHNPGHGGGTTGVGTINTGYYRGSWTSGGSQSAGGTGNSPQSSGTRASGGLGYGANAVQCGAGGGGGYYGGGSAYTAGGGGGSSYTSSRVSNVVMTQGTRSGNGMAAVTYLGASTSGNATIYKDPGTYTYTVPETGSYYIGCYGAAGGGSVTDIHYASSGGRGGFIGGNISLKKGDKLYCVVGGKGSYSSAIGTGGGYNGGGHGGPGGYGGGGMSHISTSGAYVASSGLNPYTATTTGTTSWSGDVAFNGQNGSSYSSSDNSAWVTAYSYTSSSAHTVSFYSDSSTATDHTIDPVCRIVSNGTVLVKDDDGGDGYNFSTSASVSAGATVQLQVCSYRSTGGTVHCVATNICYSTTTTRYKSTASFNESGLIMCAGGGGGADDFESNNYLPDNASTISNDGGGGHGGGSEGTATKRDGVVCSTSYYASNGVNGDGCGMPGTQSAGFARGVGESVTAVTDTGGAGAGYYGGYVSNYNNGGGAGGSSWSSSSFSSVITSVGANDGNGLIVIMPTQTTVASGTWNKDGTFLIAGGGGGADNSSLGSTGDGDDGSGGYGGGDTAGNAKIDGKDSVSAKGTGQGGTQSTGFAQGYGQSNITLTDTGGAGAGWYGGCVTAHNNGGAGGGSAYSTSDVSHVTKLSGAQTEQRNDYTFNGNSASQDYGKGTLGAKTNGNGRVRVTWKGDAGTKATASAGAWSAATTGVSGTENALMAGFEEVYANIPSVGEEIHFSSNRGGSYTYRNASSAVSTWTNSSKSRFLFEAVYTSSTGLVLTDLVTNFTTK